MAQHHVALRALVEELWVPVVLNQEGMAHQGDRDGQDEYHTQEVVQAGRAVQGSPQGQGEAAVDQLVLEVEDQALILGMPAVRLQME